MIAKLKPQPRPLGSEHQEQLLAMLPTIRRVARQAFSHRDPESREEAVAEVVAAACLMFASLVCRGREGLAYASVLAAYGVRRVRIGRQAATPQNVHDVSARYCRLMKGLQLERLDRFDRDAGGWCEVLLEDRHAGPAETAAARIDLTDWMSQLPTRDRAIAEALAVGERTQDVSRQFGLSEGRISQKRREFHAHWRAFQGEAPAESAATAG